LVINFAIPEFRSTKVTRNAWANHPRVLKSQSK
jgi:hypothetical protein